MKYGKYIVKENQQIQVITVLLELKESLFKKKNTELHKATTT